MQVKKMIKLINNERINPKITPRKANTCPSDLPCPDPTSIDFCMRIDYAHCTLYAVDDCNKDYAACSQGALDLCDWTDYAACHGAGQNDLAP